MVVSFEPPNETKKEQEDQLLLTLPIVLIAYSGIFAVR